MAKRDDFDFDAESGGKFKLDLSFLANLTKQQKGIILIAAVAVVLVIAIVVTVVLVGANSGNGGGNDTPDDSSTSGDGTPGDGDGEAVLPEDIIEFYISAEPTKKIYYIGDTADYSGLTVYVRSETLGSVSISYDDAPDSFTFTGFDSSRANEALVITVEYAGSVADFTVQILDHSEARATLVGITVNPLPKTTYKVGKQFNPTGGVIVAEYSDGTIQTIDLTLAKVPGVGAIAYTPGEHQVRVVYSDDHGGYAETYITVTITE